MRIGITRLFASVILWTACQTHNLWAQTQAPLDQQAATAFSASRIITSVHLSGVAMIGDSSAPLPASFSASTAGQLTTTISFPDGDHTEQIASASAGNTCTIITPAKSFASQSTECTLPIPWFFPYLMLSSAARPSQVAVGPTSAESCSGSCLDFYINVPAVNAATAAQIAAQDRVTVVFDPATHLPVKLLYHQTPDDGSPRSVTVEVDFSDYRNTGGVMAPFEIDKLVNGHRFIKLTVSTYSFQ